MQHVGVGHHDVPAAADGPARRFRRVAVEGEGLDVLAKVRDQRVHLVHLVLAEGLGGKQVEGPGMGIVQDAGLVLCIQIGDQFVQRLKAF